MEVDVERKPLSDGEIARAIAGWLKRALCLTSHDRRIFLAGFELGEEDVKRGIAMLHAMVPCTLCDKPRHRPESAFCELHAHQQVLELEEEARKAGFGLKIEVA